MTTSCSCHHAFKLFCSSKPNVTGEGSLSCKSLLLKDLEAVCGPQVLYKIYGSCMWKLYMEALYWKLYVDHRYVMCGLCIWTGLIALEQNMDGFVPGCLSGTVERVEWRSKLWSNCPSHLPHRCLTIFPHNISLTHSHVWSELWGHMTWPKKRQIPLENTLKEWRLTFEMSQISQVSRLEVVDLIRVCWFVGTVNLKRKKKLIISFQEQSLSSLAVTNRLGWDGMG